MMSRPSTSHLCSVQFVLAPYCLSPHRFGSVNVQCHGSTHGVAPGQSLPTMGGTPSQVLSEADGRGRVSAPPPDSAYFALASLLPLNFECRVRLLPKHWRKILHRGCLPPLLSSSYKVTYS